MTFEEKVRNFFKKHNPGYAYLAPKIARSFAHNQSAVMEHLHARFVKGVESSFDPNKVVAKPAPVVNLEKEEAEDTAVAAIEEAPVSEETPSAEEVSDEDFSVDAEEGEENLETEEKEQ